MDQRSIVLYFHVKEIQAQSVQIGLVATIESKTVVYSAVIKCLRNASYCPWTKGTSNDQEDQVMDKADKAILTELSK
jgi:hypothetical protein